MYQFNIKKQDTGGYKFELGGINILTEEYMIQDDRHKLMNPSKTIAYFSVDDNIFGVANDPLSFNTAEELYDSINKQYSIFTTSSKNA